MGPIISQNRLPGVLPLLLNHTIVDLESGLEMVQLNLENNADLSLDSLKSIVY